MIITSNGEQENIDFYNKIIELVKEEITKITYMNEDFYGGYTIKIVNEQYFDVQTDQEQMIEEAGGIHSLKFPKIIYIVMRFYSTSISYGKNIIPASIVVMSEPNGNSIAQKLMSDFTSLYNTTISQDYKIKQIYQAPTSISAFNEVGAVYRSVLSVDALYLYSEDSSYTQIYYITKDEQEEDVENEISCIKYGSAYNNSLSSTAFFSSDTTTNNDVVNVPKIAAFAFTMVIYLTTNDFCNKVVSLMDGFEKNDYIFNFHIKRFPSGIVSNRQNFVLYSATEDKSIDNFQILTLTFALADK